MTKDSKVMTFCFGIAPVQFTCFHSEGDAFERELHTFWSNTEETEMQGDRV